MNNQDKIIERKINRGEQEYQNLLIKTEYMKDRKAKIKKEIQFYKAAITRLSFIYDVQLD